MIALIAAIAAALALNTQAIEPPQRFQNAIAENGVAVFRPGDFIGMEGPGFGKYADETLFAGIDLVTLEPVTGP